MREAIHRLLETEHEARDLVQEAEGAAEDTVRKARLKAAETIEQARLDATRAGAKRVEEAVTAARAEKTRLLEEARRGLESTLQTKADARERAVEQVRGRLLGTGDL